MSNKTEEIKNNPAEEAEKVAANKAANAQGNEADGATEEAKEPTVEDKLAAAEAQIEELKKLQLYKAAEFDNFRKRVMQEKADLIKNGGAKVLTAILPIIDDFERAEQNMEKLEDVAACKEGVHLIIEKFMKLLGQEGLKKMETVGKEFDTDFHEAVAMVPGMPEGQKGKVIDCVQEGYMLGEKVLRHAKVAVAQ